MFKLKFKKSQIAIFIIISTILILSIIFYFSMNKGDIHIFTKDKSSYKVKLFVDNCLDRESKEAEKLIALHSGWLYHREMTFTNSKNPPSLNKVAQGYNFLDKIDMPYWYYYDDSNKEFVFNIPKFSTNDKYSIRNQMQQYLSENIERRCIHGFQDFKDVYNIDYDKENFSKNIKVEFVKDKIFISLNSPVKIVEKNTNNTEFIDKFNVKLENQLLVPYNLARDIVLAEANSSFLEFRMLNFISAYQRTDSHDYLPPFYDFSLKFDFKPWDLDKVRNLIKDIFASNLWEIQFKNTDYKEISLSPNLQDSDFAKHFYQSYIKDYISSTSLVKETNPSLFAKYKNFKVEPVYDIFYPTYIKISPSFGNKLLLPRPQAFFNLIPFFFTEYVAVYEISTPIIFKITSANKYNPFTFKFAVEANIDHNLPLKDNHRKDYHFDKLDSGSSLICNPNQFISGIYSINITDSVDYGKAKLGQNKKIGVNNAYVSFNCKGLTTCFIGMTKINGKYKNKNITNFKFRLPIDCNPGKLEIQKFGHRKIVIDNLDPKLSQNVDLGEYDMPSAKKMKFKVKIIQKGLSKFSAGRAIADNETGFVIFNCLNDSSMISVVSFNKSNINNLSLDLTLCDYKIEGYIISNKKTIIPAEKKCFSKGGGLASLFTGGGKKCFKIPEIKLNSWITAGTEIKDFKVNKGMLLGRKSIVLPFIDYKTPHNFDELEEASKSLASLDKELPFPYFE